jgi:prepilin-type N-terminal cleavage/methylation domain-containing protein
MNGGRRPQGYTIIEVMIVLAISGVMFVIAASFISGKEASSAFTEGTNEFASQLQTYISQVTDGQYSDVNLTCNVAVPGNTLTFNTAASGSSIQGTNSQCDFLGKFIHFSVSSDPTSYEVFSLAGARTDDTLASATPVIGNGIDLTDQNTIPQSLRVVDVKVTDTGGATHNSYGIGFVQSQADCDVNDSCVSGAQTVYMVYSPGLNVPVGATLDELAASTAIAGNLNTATAADICLTDGTRYAELTIGDSSSSGSQLNVNVDVYTRPYVQTPPC